MQIEHDPNEPPRRAYNDWWLFPACFVMLAVAWIWVLLTKETNWLCLGLGFLTGGIFAFWAAETFPGPYKSPPKDTPPDRRRDL